MKKSITAALIITVVLMGFLAGCKGKSAGTAGSAQGGLNFTGYPMNAQDKTITWFASNGYLPNQAYAAADQSPFHAGLKEMLGVNIEWVFPTTGTDANQAFNLMMASDTLPDVIFHGLMSDAERYINEGTIRDLSPHIKEWSPAYYAWLQTEEAYDRAMKTDSGKYYGYGFFREDGGWNDTYLGPVVNKTWLDECGLPVPQTLDDWDKTLRAFKDKYGAVLSFAWSRVSGYGTFISGAFGAYSFADYRLYVDKNNKIQLANVQPEFRAEMAKMNEWWRAGLIDQDMLSINDTMARSNALNKKMGLSLTSMGQLSNWVTDAGNAGNGAEWIGLQYPRGNDGALVMVPGGYGIGSNAAAISTNCSDDKLELVMRALDYAYTEEGNLYWNFGKRGVSWDYDSAGNPAYLPLVTNDPDGLNNAIDKFGGSTWSGNCIQATALLYMKNTQQAIDANDLWFYPNEAVSAAWTLPNGMTMTPEESTRAAELRNPISTFVGEAAIQFISGQAGLSTWDSYVSRVNAMGLSELLSIYQAAYDRYLNR
jgi:putative aldouronate transport system substrate-binding protein